MEGVLSTIHQYYNTQSCELDEDETKNIKIAAIGARLGGRFNHISKFEVMKFKEATNGPDSSKWKEEIESEHTRMVTNGTSET